MRTRISNLFAKTPPDYHVGIRLVNRNTAIAERLDEMNAIIASTPDLEDADRELLHQMAVRQGQADADYEPTPDSDYPHGLPFTPVRQILLRLAPWGQAREGAAHLRVYARVAAPLWAAQLRGEDAGLADDEIAWWQERTDEEADAQDILAAYRRGEEYPWTRGYLQERGLIGDDE